MGLIDMPPGRIEGGDIRYHGESLLKMSDEQMGHIRGNGIASLSAPFFFSSYIK